MSSLDLRLRVASPALLALPWRQPLAEWDVTAVPFRDIPVGPSRHLVRFVEADGHIWALKALPEPTARREYDVLRSLEDRSLSAVRAAGFVRQPGDGPGEAVLVTHYLEGSWQYRRMLMRVPLSHRTHRARLFDAMAALLVDLHRNGVYWGDCSLANTLFMRDGQVIQAWLVDAETAELHPVLSAGQRQQDLDILVENVTGGLLDVAARREELPDASDQIFEEASSIAERYEGLWGLLHDEPIIGLGDQQEIGARVQDLNELGFAVDEVRLETAAADELEEPPPQPGERVRMKVAVAGRTFHSEQLATLTGLQVGEGQAKILIDDLRAYRKRLQEEWGHHVPEAVAASHWVIEHFIPGSELAHEALQRHGTPTQAYCDLLEVRWLLSEEAGFDVGQTAALAALRERETPGDSAANLAFVDVATEELPVIDLREDEDGDQDD